MAGDNSLNQNSDVMTHIYEKFKTYGADSLSNHELLSLITSNKESAKKVLDHFGSLRAIGKEHFQSIAFQSGIGKKEAERLNLCFEVGRRYSTENLSEEIKITSPESAAAYLSPRFRDLKQERFIVLFLNNAKVLESQLTVSIGSSHATVVDVKQVVKEAIVREARSVILSHNHPSGYMKESMADINITRQIKRALDFVQITVDDHIIIAGDQYISFRNKELL